MARRKLPSVKLQSANYDLWALHVPLTKDLKPSTSVPAYVDGILNAAATHAPSFVTRVLVAAAERPSLKRSAALAARPFSSLHFLVVRSRQLVDLIVNDRKLAAILPFPTTAMATMKNVLNVPSWHKSRACAGRRRLKTSRVGLQKSVVVKCAAKA